MTRPNSQSGFSAVELLITLFIAVAFIATGYQLYTIVIKDGGESRARAKASNIAYDNLRKYSSLVTNPCTATSSPSPTPTIPAGSGLTATTLTVTFSCPYGTSSAVTEVKVQLLYGSPQQEVAHAMYVTTN
jgi:Tfp pilus assembly protein PilE